MHIPLRALILIASLTPLSTAIPTFEHATPVIQQQNTHRISSTTSSRLSLLCSGIIQRIWPQHKSRKNKSEDIRTLYPPSSHSTRHSDDVVLRFKIRTEQEAIAFAEAAEILYLDVWDSTEDWVDLRISKDILPSFLGLLPSSLHEAYTPIIRDLSQAVHETYPSSKGHRISAQQPETDMPRDLFFENYQPLAVLYPWLRQIASMFPDRAALFTIGKSWEGRDIPALRLGTEPADDDPHKDEPRHTIVITAGSHAREWISVSTAAYMLRGLVHNYGHGWEARLIEKLLRHFDIIFVPVMNPDGYEYTWSTDRLWRKNRQQTSLPFCPGIDIDRAFPMGWDGHNEGDNPCTESYAGEAPMQAVEAKALVDWAINETNSGDRLFTAFLDLHSYSQRILYPYSYTCDRTPHNLEDLEEIAIGLAKAFRLSTGHFYGVDSACEGTLASSDKDTVKPTRIEESGGSALDFFYQNIGIRYAFQIKLRDTGTYGFLLPKENIVPTGKEAFGALIGLGKWLLGNRGIESIDATDELWGVDNKAALQEENLNDVNADDEEELGWWEELRRRRR